MRRTLVAVLAVLASVTDAAVHAQTPSAPEKVEIEGMGPWGKVTHILEPEYSKSMLAARPKGSVEIAGRVGATGRMLDAVFTPDSPEAAVFVEPLRAAVEHWKFITPTDDDCQPTGKIVRNRVWFDLDGDKPRLSVLLVREPSDGSPLASMKPLKRVDPTYPYSMQRRGWQADVFAKVVVDPAGDVVSVTAQAYPKQEQFDLGHFVRESIDSLKLFRFSAAPGLESNRVGCYTLLFRLK